MFEKSVRMYLFLYYKVYRVLDHVCLRLAKFRENHLSSSGKLKWKVLFPFYSERYESQNLFVFYENTCEYRERFILKSLPINHIHNLKSEMISLFKSILSVSINILLSSKQSTFRHLWHLTSTRTLYAHTPFWRPRNVKGTLRECREEIYCLFCFSWEIFLPQMTSLWNYSNLNTDKTQVENYVFLCNSIIF